MEYILKYDDGSQWDEFKSLCNKTNTTMAEVLRQHIKIFIKAEGNLNKIAEGYNKLNEVI